jgi:phosphatidate cytidylyltransferase
MLRLRVATAAVGVPIVILAIWFGHPWFSLLLTAVTVCGAWELYRMAGIDPRRPLIYLGVLWATALLLSPYYPSTAVLGVITAVIILGSLTSLLGYSPRERASRDWSWMIAGAMYTGWMLSYWLSLRALPQGREMVLLAIVATFANDTAAFFVGRARGRHRLAPGISPAKTWEGAAGGAFGAVLGIVITAMVLKALFSFHFEHWQILLLGLAISVFAQLGDLVESLFKRNFKVKEAGFLLPGHGGVLDRFDSIIFVGVVMYYYVVWVL